MKPKQAYGLLKCFVSIKRILNVKVLSEKYDTTISELIRKCAFKTLRPFMEEIKLERARRYTLERIVVGTPFNNFPGLSDG